MARILIILVLGFLFGFILILAGIFNWRFLFKINRFNIFGSNACRISFVISGIAVICWVISVISK